MPSDTFSIGDLTAVIGDNDAAGQHRAGYNGLWSLTHKTEPTNLFVPTVAGGVLAEGEVRRLQDAGGSGRQPLPPVCGGRTRQWHYLGAVQLAGPLTEMVLLGFLATRLPNTDLKWDTKGLRVTNVEEANKFVKRTPRKGWEVAGL